MRSRTVDLVTEEPVMREQVMPKGVMPKPAMGILKIGGLETETSSGTSCQTSRNLQRWEPEKKGESKTSMRTQRWDASERNTLIEGWRLQGWCLERSRHLLYIYNGPQLSAPQRKGGCIDRRCSKTASA